MWHLNISMNPLENFNIERLADLCNLRSIDISRTKLSKCQCQQLNNHLIAIQVDTKFVPVCLGEQYKVKIKTRLHSNRFNYTYFNFSEIFSDNLCPLPYNQTIDSESFQKCKTIIPQAEARNAFFIWSSSIIIILLFLLCEFIDEKLI